MSSRIAVTAFILLCTMVLGMPGAMAGCYENVGCTAKEYFSKKALREFSCQNLAFLRNSIYGENGYCFKSAEYSSMFADECRFENSADVPLNNYERANVVAILEIERNNGCR